MAYYSNYPTTDDRTITIDRPLVPEYVEFRGEVMSYERYLKTIEEERNSDCRRNWND